MDWTALVGGQRIAAGLQPFAGRVSLGVVLRLDLADVNAEETGTSGRVDGRYIDTEERSMLVSIYSFIGMHGFLQQTTCENEQEVRVSS